MEERKRFGKFNKDVVIPVAPDATEFGENYDSFIHSVIDEVKKRRMQIVLQANQAMLLLYWHIGKTICKKQKEEGWGTKVIDRISRDLQKTFPDMKGFSPRNIKYMKKFATMWQDETIVQRLVAQLPWGTNIVLMDKVASEKERIWYARKALEKGWSRNVLAVQVESNVYGRSGKSLNNFKAALPPEKSDMVAQIFKDPYLFDFFGTDVPRRELDIEKKLTEHIQEFLLELGQGFAFVGRQVHLEVGGDDFYIDLLFYHLKIRCYVVIELKACEFEPGFVSQLNMYQNVVNTLLRHPNDNPTIGLLLVKGKNKTVVEYSLEGYHNPIGVADWKNELGKEISVDIQSSLPSIEQIEREMELGSENPQIPNSKRRRRDEK